MLVLEVFTFARRYVHVWGRRKIGVIVRVGVGEAAVGFRGGVRSWRVMMCLGGGRVAAGRIAAR